MHIRLNMPRQAFTSHNSNQQKSKPHGSAPTSFGHGEEIRDLNKLNQTIPIVSQKSSLVHM